MKVGILNVQWLNNYGAVLLAYAMQKKLDYLGVENEIIDFRPRKPNLNGEIPNAHKEVKPSSYKKIQRFEQFRANYLRRSKPVFSTEEISRLNYDGYIVGSDTVWTPQKINDIEAEVFYLNFAKNMNVWGITWSASIGSDEKADLDMMRPILEERLRHFSYISIRERETTTFVQSLTDKTVVHTADPVFMLNKEDYTDILHGTFTQGEKYIYAFMINNLEGAYKTINELSKKSGLRVVANVKSIDKIDNVLFNSEDDGPAEFIGRIMNAEYIISDSYHGIVFAILFEKQFICYSREGSSIRARNLLEDIELSNRFFSGNKSDTKPLFEEINYGAVFKRIYKWRIQSEDYLRHALKDYT